MVYTPRDAVYWEQGLTYGCAEPSRSGSSHVARMAERRSTAGQLAECALVPAAGRAASVAARGHFVLGHRDRGHPARLCKHSGSPSTAGLRAEATRAREHLCRAQPHGRSGAVTGRRNASGRRDTQGCFRGTAAGPQLSDTRRCVWVIASMSAPMSRWSSPAR
jgi:hypothetical protein